MKESNARRLTHCQHFNGIQHDKCKAGVPYASFSNEKRPCLKGLGDGRECARYIAETVERLEADERDTDRVVALVMAGKSPCCEATLDKREVGRHSEVAHCSKCKAFVYRGCGRGR